VIAIRGTDSDRECRATNASIIVSQGTSRCGGFRVVVARKLLTNYRHVLLAAVGCGLFPSGHTHTDRTIQSFGG
jgi:hypothetical protein